MILKYLKTLLPAQNGESKIAGMAWSHNNLKLAVCTADRVIVLFDETGEKRDKFSTKPIDSKYGKKSYHVKGIAFSPDSTKLAVGQSDNIIFVYRIGEDWGDKKVICNKFVQTASVTCLLWLLEGPLVYGLSDGKVRGANVKSNKSHTLYQTESYVLSLASNSNGTAFLSGHADGTIVRYYVVKSERMLSQGRILKHPVPPYALGWTANHIAVGGCDGRVVFYSGSDGRLAQQFDFSRDQTEKEFSCAAVSPSGQSVVFGSFDRVRVFDWSPQRGVWSEAPCRHMPHMYTIGCAAWRRDGSRLACSGLCGAVQLFDSAIKKAVWNNSWEVTYVGPSQVLIKPVKEGGRGVILKSQFGHEIVDVKFMGGDKYLVARTPETLLVGDLTRNLLSEVSWLESDRKEKFFFENVGCCVVFSAGEMYLIEYGNNEVLGSVRTEFMNPHLMSIRINERPQRHSPAANKKMAFLLDLKTIAVVDLIYGVNSAVFSHDTRLDWLELNETSSRLLFRDKRLRVILADVDAKSSRLLATDCAFVQWIPGSDVVVAQCRQIMHVWYDIDAPERVFTAPLKGDIIAVDRSDNRAEVIAQDSKQEYTYKLDDGLIEFGTAIDDGDYSRAMTYLESLPDSSAEAENMWRTLARLCLETSNLDIADRCYAALGDVSKCRYLRNILALIERKTGHADFSVDAASVEVKARLAVLNGRLKQAENVYIENNQPHAAINMYKNLLHWQQALEIARTHSPSDWSALKSEYFDWLMSTDQLARAACLYHEQGESARAVQLYLRCGLPARAANVVMTSAELAADQEMIDRISRALTEAELHEPCGQLFLHCDRLKEAMSCFRRAAAFSGAVTLARKHFPNMVVELEEEWGDHLMLKREHDAAISHYIEAGRSVKALDAAVQASQWKKAVEIAEVCSQDASVHPFLQKIAQHVQQAGDFEIAERLFVNAGNHTDAVEMYNKAGQWSKAYKIASEHMSGDQVETMYVQLAGDMETSGQHQQAEQVYVMIGHADQAISMYKKLGLYEDMMRLVAGHHCDIVSQTHIHLARELEASGRRADAEKHFVLGGDWRAAVDMWRAVDLWEEAYRVAEDSAADTADRAIAEQVAYSWARSVGGQGAVKLLTRLNLLESAVQTACNHQHFEFAYELAGHCVSAVQKLNQVRHRHAMALENEGRFSDAEGAFVAAGETREAIVMHVRGRRWSDAQRVAQTHDTAALADILVAQARDVFEQQHDYGRFEALLLQAGRSEVAVGVYKEAGMWADALRVCRDYAPHKLAQLEQEYDASLLRPSTDSAHESYPKLADREDNVSSLLERAVRWQRADDIARAVDCYMQVQLHSTADKSLLQRAWITATQLAVKFLPAEKAAAVSADAGSRLTSIGLYQPAAQVYLAGDHVREAIEALIQAGEWQKAIKVASELAPALQMEVDDRYKNYLTSEGQVETLASVDAVKALDLMADQQQWQRCIELAASQSQHLLHKYLAKYADFLLNGNDGGRAHQVLRLFVKYGAPLDDQCQEIYRRVALLILSEPNPGLDEIGADLDKDIVSSSSHSLYTQYSELRDFLFDISARLESASPVQSSGVAASSVSMTRLLMLSHLMAARVCYLSHKQLTELAGRVSLSLLRFIDVLPADLTLYETGVVCRHLAWKEAAFVLWNWCLDVCDVIDEGDDVSSGLRGAVATAADQLNLTDIPADAPLPSQRALSDQRLNHAKEWLLAVSLDQQANSNIQPKLPVDERALFVASLRSTLSDSAPSKACVITGYPVLDSGRACVNFHHGYSANRDDWNTAVMASKVSNSTALSDLLNFVSKWAGSGQHGFDFS